MKPYYEDDETKLFRGDCVEVMAAMEPESVDAVVCDPPYELGFMGRAWDASGVAYRPETWAAALRVLKPGGHLLAFGGSRTYHRMAVAVEDAGFEIRDTITWHYGSGFPKSLDVSKAIDKKRDDREDVLRVTTEVARLRDASGLTNRDLDGLFGFAGMAGHWTSTKSQPTVPTPEQWTVLRQRLGPPQWLDDEVWRLNGRKGSPGENWEKREVTGTRMAGIATPGDVDRHTIGGSRAVEVDVTAPATPEAVQWSGWGTALKPATEFVVVARKPLTSTVAGNVLEHGTGALNIDGCRIEGVPPSVPQPRFGTKGEGEGTYDYRAGEGRNGVMSAASGRWPANVVLDPEAATLLDQQSGVTKDGTAVRRNVGKSGGNFPFGAANPDMREDVTFGGEGGASRFFYCAKASRTDRGTGNTHPTVKPVELMRWLVRLVTPPGGTVLDPFAGSGTTLIAAVIEGFHAIGIERDMEYVNIIRRRLTAPIEPVLDFGGQAP